MNPLTTYFASPERSPREIVQEQFTQISKSGIIGQLLDSMPVSCAVLNLHRQIVFANRTFAGFVRSQGDGRMLGLRPGEALSCVNSSLGPGGCGTTEFCQVCGSIKAVLNSQKGISDEQEWNIFTKKGEALELEASAAPLNIEKEWYTLLVVQDRSGEKRRRMLERIFFHDVLNTASGIYGCADLLCESFPPEDETFDLAKMIFQLSDSIIQEIQAQKDLLAAESNDLIITSEAVDSLELLGEVAGRFRYTAPAKHKIIEISPNSAAVRFSTDRTILRRVLGNMLKNAIEASRAGEKITLESLEDEGGVLFSVHNPAALSYEAQLNIFKRSFTTKGKGRGLGTYSIKLLSEKFLKGHVSFETSPEKGTTFIAQYPKSLQMEQ